MLDESFCAKLGIVPKFWFPLRRDKAVDADSLHNALRNAVAGGKSAMLMLHGGGRERLKLGRKPRGHQTLRSSGFASRHWHMLEC